MAEKANMSESTLNPLPITPVAENDTQVSEVVVTANKGWGYNLDVNTFNDRSDVVETHRVTGKNAVITLGESGELNGNVPANATLEVHGNDIGTNYWRTQIQAGANVNMEGGESLDIFSPHIAPATTQEQLDTYKPGTVVVDGGGGNDALAIPGNNIITRLPDGKNGEAQYRVTDSNGYGFDARNVERVINTTQEVASAPILKRNGPDLPEPSQPGVEMNTLGLKPGESITVYNATKAIYDPRIPEFNEAQENALKAALEKGGNPLAVKPGEVQQVSLGDYGAAPTPEQYAGDLPSPRIVDPHAQQAAQAAKPGGPGL